MDGGRGCGEERGSGDQLQLVAAAIWRRPGDCGSKCFDGWKEYEGNRSDAAGFLFFNQRYGILGAWLFHGGKAGRERESLFDGGGTAKAGRNDRASTAEYEHGGEGVGEAISGFEYESWGRGRADSSRIHRRYARGTVGAAA